MLETAQSLPDEAQLNAFKQTLIHELGEAGYYALIGSYVNFKEVYQKDFIAAAHDIFVWRDGESPTEYQDDILGMVSEGGKTAVQSLHGVGKTTVMSWLVLIFALTRDGDPEHDWKMPITASAWRQLKFYLFPEVKKWAQRLRWDKIGRVPFNERKELLRLSLSLTSGEAMAVASDNAGLIEGAHADKMAYLFDEAKLIPAATFDAAEGAFSSANPAKGREAWACAASTPGDPSGRFYDICRRAPGFEKWKIRRITLDEALRAGTINPEWVEEMANAWGRDSSIFINKVLGDFAAQDETAVIPLAWVEEAQRIWAADYAVSDETGRPIAGGGLDPEKIGELTGLALDVSDGGGDLNVLAPLFGDNVVGRPHAWFPPPNDHVNTARQVANVLDAHGKKGVVQPIVDGIGVGSGIVALLKNWGYKPISFIASERTDLKDASKKLGFLNQRSAAIWNCRERLNPKSGDNIALPPIPELTQDLTTPKWKEIAGAKIAVESKVEIKKRLEGRTQAGASTRRRSTDYGDAVVMLLFAPLVKKRKPKTW
jgi:hypothetical protein